jgi:hypothetical protein
VNHGEFAKLNGAPAEFQTLCYKRSQAAQSIFFKNPIGKVSIMKLVLNFKMLALALVAVCSTFASVKAQAQWGGGRGERGEWTYCAAEGQVCSVSGLYDLAYGADNRWVYEERATVPGRFVCRTQTFHDRDPARGTVKSCWVKRVRGSGGPGGGGHGGGGWRPEARWTYCAEEGQVCRTGRPATVRYGVPGAWRTQETQVGIACTNGQFGDPAPGRRKQCEYSTR